jgi:sirohydrochlorin ferrochelatase
MATSPERIEACRVASLSATGPRSTTGKEASRRNSTVHGLSGSGRVIPEGDVAEVDRRASSYIRDLDVRTDIGRDLARLLAIMAFRMDQCARHEAMAIAHGRRHAIDRHDDARQDEADRLFAALGEDPRGNLRRLKRMPEGVDLLVEAWQGLRAELTREPRPRWTPWHREQAENLTGNRSDHNPYTEIGDLSDEIQGPASGPLDEDDPVEEAAKAKARARMTERIDAEIAALVAHRKTLDHAMLDLDRQEAPDRAIFDDSKAAQLARRYEAEASRRYFKLLAQLRQAEAEAAERAPVAATPVPPSPSSPYGSFRVPPRQEPYAPIGGFGGPTSPAHFEEDGEYGAFAMTPGRDLGPPSTP